MNPSSTQVLWSEPVAGCIVLSLNRPERGNALSASLVQALDDAIDRAEALQPQLVVLRGEGRHFCTGFDLSDLQAETDDSLLARFTRVELMLQRLYHATFPTLALAHGRTLGAGADLFCACNDRWILGDASFAFPGAGFGLVLGTRRLAQRVGTGRAQGWIESGAIIDADSALTSTLATSRLQPDALQSAIDDLLKRKTRLDADTRRAIHQVVAAPTEGMQLASAADLAQLVRSAARPGLKGRIERYRALQLRS